MLEDSDVWRITTHDNNRLSIGTVASHDATGSLCHCKTSLQPLFFTVFRSAFMPLSDEMTASALSWSRKAFTGRTLEKFILVCQAGEVL
jgi:hypothetical protein